MIVFDRKEKEIKVPEGLGNINLTILDANLEDKTVEINEVETTILPSSGYDGMSSLQIDAQPVYDNGYNEGENIGYNSGYTAGIDYASENAGEIAAANAIVLYATENKSYYTKYVDIPEIITGEFEDGTPFYSYAELDKISYDTGISADSDAKIELWWCGDVTQFDRYIFYGKARGANDGNFKVCVVNNDNLTNALYAEINNKGVNKQNLENDVWYHIELSKQEGFKINGELIGTFEGVGDAWNYSFYINTLVSGSSSDTYANGKFGMIKINDTIIIPTPDGFLNTNTNEILSTKNISTGGKYFYKNRDFTPIDNLIKQVNVNVKINLVENGIKLAYSTFVEVPDFYDFSNVTDMSNMFTTCTKLQTIPSIDTSNVTNMNSMFQSCLSLQTIPLINTSNVTNMAYMFNGCKYLQTIPEIDTSNVTDMNNMLYSCTSLTSIPALQAGKLNMTATYAGVIGATELPKITYFGGFIGLKNRLIGNYNLIRLPNLNYQSCINVLNGLYDFTGNGETPTSNQGQLQVHQNFLTTIGDEISIGTNKGWAITA